MSSAEIGRKTNRFRALCENTGAKRRAFQHIKQAHDAFAFRRGEGAIRNRFGRVEICKVCLQFVAHKARLPILKG